MLLPEDQREAATRFAIHPALLDSALHATLLAALHAEEQGSARMPFSWSGVSVLAGGPEALRVRLQGGEEQVAIDLCDAEGIPLAKIGSLRTRPVSPEQMRSARATGQELFELNWVKTPLPEASELETTLLDTREWELDADPIEASHAIAAKGLEAIQAHLAGEEAAERLVFLTEGPLSATPEEDPSLPAATLAGLLRSAASEHPGGFGLIDTDGSEASSDALPSAIAASALEPQIALREGEALVARLTEAKGDAGEAEGSPAFDPDKTILITGATGGLGALFARHLAETHGARHLLLASRSGEKAKGAKELQAELEELGAKATIVACDVSDRDQLTELLDSIPEANPLGAVIHAAGVLDDGLIADLDPKRLAKVMGPKANAAHHLHELTKGLDLDAFVLFSSIAGPLGGPGQGNYAAANSFLDALAQKRSQEGLTATSIAWGAWERESGMTAGLSEADLARMRRGGIGSIADEQGLQLFNAAIGTAASQAVAINLNRSGLRDQAAAGTLPPLFGGLIRGAARRKAVSGQLAAKLATVPETEREAFVLEAVRAEVAAVLGHDSATSIDPERSFKDLGFDSLAAVELRNRLVAATGVQLPATMAFDYPSAAALARFLLTEVDAGGATHEVAVRAQASDEPIAIVGMACRYPGEVSSPESLWELVTRGTDGITEFPADRGWDVERLYDPDLEAGAERRTSYTREGGFLHDSGEFDAEFFGISPREALVTDPQQRLLLETSWQALEDAGIDPGGLSQTQTGVFAGVMYQDYGEAAGMTQSIVSGRVAYTLGLEGPAITVDTACSSSLVAMHWAAQSLRSGECSLALAGGVTVLSTPGVFVEFSRQRGLAPDGRSKSFAEAADGVGWAEGVGVLALERLSDAKRNGHEILATIKGSAVNQDGASNGLTAPNGPSQERVIRQALANARLEPKDVDAVEAHGTGTTLGDPIEAGALLATYGQDREQPLRLGSIKSNIGHTQAAAGVAGVIKMVQAMRHGVLPKTLHVDAPSSKVDWEAGEVELLTEEALWQPNGAPRRAGVSSFGISGTNAHVIVEEAPAPEPTQGTEVKEAPEPPLGAAAIALPLSAKAEPALREMAANLATHLQDNPDLDPKDAAFSLTTTRALFERRGVVTGSDRDQLLAGLAALSQGEGAPNLFEAKARPGKLAYLLTGQGAQRAGMGKELYESSPTFKAALDDACEAIDPHIGRPLKELLFAKEGSKRAALLEDTTFTQPALFAIEVALFRTFEALGMKPDYLTGHSVGEIAAAHLSGVLSLEDAAKLISARARLMGELSQGGAMVAIEATEEEVKEALEGKEAELSIAAINGPTSIVISGQEQDAEEIQARFEEQGKRTKRLTVSHAFHSPLIEPMLEAFQEVAKTLAYHEPKIPIVSNLTGEILTAEQAQDPSYWVSHARAAVRFAKGIETLDAQGVSAYLELGPDAVLTAMAASCLPEGSEAALIPTLRSGKEEGGALLGALAQAHASGAKLDWAKLYPSAKRVGLPTYPFQRERYWLTGGKGMGGDPSAIGQREVDHPMLAAALEDPDGGLRLTGRISPATHPWMGDHAVLDTLILPGTGLVELALEAAGQTGCDVVEELTLQAPLLLSATESVSLQASVSAPDERGGRSLSIYSRMGVEDGEWTLHATGSLSPEAAETPEPLADWPPAGAERIDTADLYERLAEVGFDYGPAFQGLTAAWRAGEEIYAEVELPEDQCEVAGRFAIHPALLDAAFHGPMGVVFADAEGAKPILPFSWAGVRVFSAGASSLRVRTVLQSERFELLAADRNGKPVVEIGSLFGRPVERAQLATKGEGALYRIGWDELALDRAEEAGAEHAIVDARAWDLPADPVAASHSAAATALELVQAHLADEEAAGSRIVFLTEGALDAGGTGASLPAATIAGLLRSAQSENPGRVALIDCDGTESADGELRSAIAATATEPQIALREGAVLVPRLAETEEGAKAPEAQPLDPEKTILITGGLSGLGALFARHLAEVHGARHLLLVSRSGPKAKGATELTEELEAMGAVPTIAACDVSDRDKLESLIAAVPPEHPLGMVIHAAAVIDNGLIADLDPEALRKVMAPKIDAAWNLHELSADSDLDAFVLCSSAAGLLGGPGQANYAAANSFLDALATRRRAIGLPAVSLAWGLWGQETNLAGEVSQVELEAMLRQTRMLLGFAPISPARGLALLDEAASLGDSLLVPVHFDRAALRAQAKAGSLPALMRGLVRVPKGREQAVDSLGDRLAGVPEAEREAFVLDFVRGHVAAILGHDSAAAIEPEKAFKDLGFDSLGAVELRNRLVAASGMQLAATMAFDYPSAAALARYLFAEVSAGGVANKVAVRAQASDEPIAIVGMACRYPGDVASPEGLWELVAEGRDGIAEFPTDRGWDLDRLYDPDLEAGAERRTSYTREGGFLYDSAEFDADFFGISPREAMTTDPQQRLLLEACWETLEDAGVDPASLRGSQTGVFAGVMYQDYGETAGMTQSMISGRVAYTLGLEGPTMTVDTACSSSLVAMHLAAQALRSGECTLALAGGVTVLSTPGMLIYFSRQRGLSPDGRSKSFAEAADGAGWAEGVGVLALERLSDAKRNGHPVLALLKGTAVNQDGASNGVTAPNGPSQERVIRQALANARLAPKDVDAVEAHGTGTTLGDPIEAGALLATYGQDREQPLRLGSIKSNIGHTQAAAGVAGVIKMVQAMRHGVLPKTLHVDAPSSKVDWEAGEVELLTEEAPWQPGGKPRRAGVSSFGASGTNAHVIVEEAPAPEPTQGTEVKEAPEPPLGAAAIALPLSAKAEPALREMAANLATHLQDNPDLDPKDAAFSLTTTRALFERRGVVTGSDRDQLLAGLAALSQGEGAPNLFEAKARPGKLAYLLTGQGAQRAGMGKELYESSPTFKAALDEACEAIDPHIGRPLKELLFAKEGSKRAALLEDTTFTQPALFAIEVALFRTFEALGMKPDYLTGHSVGEIAAAHLSGVLSLEDAAELISARARLMGELSQGGAMVAIEATEEEVKEALEGKEAELSIAAINGPTSIVISGQEQDAEEIQARFEEQGKRTKRLTVSHAFHSPLIEPMLEAFQEVAKTLAYHEPKIPIVSNLTGEILTAEQAQDPSYWVSHARAAVRFAKGIETLDAQGVSAYLELGPDAVLTAMAASCLPEGSEAALIPTLRSGKEEGGALLGALAQAHASGAKLDWAKLYPSAKRVGLPTYPFQRERYWLTGAGGANDLGAAGLGDAEHPLLAAAIELPGEDSWLLTGRISLSTHPWLADHAVLDTAILPGTAFLELALRAGEQVGAETVEELTLQAPLVIPEQGAVALRVSVGAPDERGSRPVTIHSCAETEGELGEWVLHASGSLSAEAPTAPEPLTAWPPEGAEPLPTEDLYERLAEIGFDYGPAFQGVDAAWQQGEEIYAEVGLPEDQREVASRFAIHPALLDMGFHAGISVALDGTEASPTLPFDWHGVQVLSPGASSLRVRISTQDERFGLLATDRGGVPVVQIGSIFGRPIEQGRLAAKGKGLLYRLGWEETSLDPSDEDSATAPTIVDTGAWELPEDPVEAAHAAAAKALALTQAHLAEEDLAASRLVFTAKGAFDLPGVEQSLAAGAVAGLLRSAQSENPGRIALIDCDSTDASSQALENAIVATSTEPQIALREGRALVPRLAEAESESPQPEALDFAADKTVLITGGLSGLGALFARHLAEEHGVRHLLLVSRSGEEAPGATELREELEALRAKATIAACDVSDREQLTQLVDSIPSKHPLGAVIHSAGVFDNGLIADLDPERLKRVMAPKIDAAWHLHELTAKSDLSAFVMFSSAAGLLGGPGQANYAAANSFLDALATRRRAIGLPAVSLAWGFWGQETNLVGEMSQVEVEATLRQTRMRLGFAPIPPERGLALFGEAGSFADSLLVPVHFDRAALRAQAKAGSLPALMRGLVRVPKGREQAVDSLGDRLAGVPEAEREAFVLDFVRDHVAAVLGHDSAAAIEPEKAFKDLGFDSLAAVELRNRLVAATGVQLPATMAFDYPSAAAIARFLWGEIEEVEALPGAEAKLNAVAEILDSIPLEERGRVVSRLQSLLAELSSEGRGEDEVDLESASDEEIMQLIDEQLGGAE